MPLGRTVVAELLRGVPERAAIDGRWKFISKAERTELYDLQRDPGETTNLASAHPQRVKKFRAALTAFEQKNSPVTATSEKIEITPEQLEALRALGYVGDD